MIVHCFSLIQITRHIQDPICTTSAERALLMLMHDSYFSCPYVKKRYTDLVPQIIGLVKKEFYNQSSQNKQDALETNAQPDSQAFFRMIKEPR